MASWITWSLVTLLYFASQARCDVDIRQEAIEALHCLDPPDSDEDAPALDFQPRAGMYSTTCNERNRCKTVSVERCTSGNCFEVTTAEDNDRYTGPVEFAPAKPCCPSWFWWMVLGPFQDQNGAFWWVVGNNKVLAGICQSTKKACCLNQVLLPIAKCTQKYRRVRVLVWRKIPFGLTWRWVIVPSYCYCKHLPITQVPGGQ